MRMISPSEFLKRLDSIPNSSRKMPNSSRNMPKVVNSPKRIIEKLNENHVCDICGKEYGSKVGLTKHDTVAHKVQTKSIKCPLCDNTFDQVNTFKEHVKIVHEGKNSYKCDFCDQMCTTKQSLVIFSSPK